MTQKEIEEAIEQTEELIIDFDLSGDDRNPLNKLINLAKLHLQVMKSGVPKKKPIKVKDDIDYEAVSYNKAIDEFTAYLAQKLSGLEGIVKESSLCHLCLSNVSEGEKEVKELVGTIREYLEVER